jgi:signal transduction histidine kinase
LLTLNSQLDEANEVKTRFVGILNHDLKAPVANLVNILHLQKEGAGIIDESTAAAHSERIKARAENLLETMEDLLSWSKGQMKNFQPQWKNVSVSDVFTDIKNHFSGTPQVELLFTAPEGMILNTDEYFLKTIMRNLTSNAIKSFAGQPGGTIEWTAREEDGKQVLSITDNGPGVTETQLRPLYDESLPSSLNAGLGLHLVRDLSKAIACVIAVSSTPGKGTEFRLFV